MAGSPRKRARREARAAEPLPAPATRGHAPARDVRQAQPGPTTKAMLDSRQADELGDLASALQMGHAVRVERIRPSWCSGWVEDTDVDVGDLGELYAYLQTEWGGQQYRVTVLHVDGRPLMAVKLKVAGPPRQNGRLIVRSKWEAATAGEELPGGPPEAVATLAQPVAAPAFNPLQFVELMMNNSREGAREARDSVKELADLHSRDVQQLMQHITTKESESSQRNSLTGQIGELREGMTAISELRDSVAEDMPAAAVDEPETGGMVKRAFENFMVKSMEDSVHQPAAPTPATSRAQPQQPNGAPPVGSIPFAATRQRSN